MTFTLVTGFYNGGSQTIVVEHKLAGNQSSWYNENKEYAGEDKSVTVTVVVEGLSAETLYEFRAFAYNEYDRSMYTDILQAETNKGNVKAKALSHFNVFFFNLRHIDLALSFLKQS